MTLEPIGYVRSPVTEGVDEGWGEVTAEIVLDERLADGLRGLEQFSHVLVIFLMHQASFEPGSDLLRRPRGRADMPLLGIFAQRAKHRPNPIGVTTVRLLRIEGNRVTVSGLDAIDGTPVLDLKPYVPAFDRPEGATVPEWMDELMRGYF
jgi:tRNA (adenine37-N6)-methyltransferase